MPNRLVDSHGNKYQKQSEISVKVPSISPTPWKTQGLIRFEFISTKVLKNFFKILWLNKQLNDEFALFNN